MSEQEYLTRLLFVHSEAERLLELYGLKQLGWSFKLNTNTQRVGVCKFDIKRIEFSQHFMERNSEYEIRDTILHEIAHALVGPHHGHDAVWRAKCREIGARPERLADDSVKTTAKYNYIVKCRVHPDKHFWKRYRLKDSMRRAYCCGQQVQCFKYVPKPK